MEKITVPMEEKRFVVQIFDMDNSQENPVMDAFAISCPDAESRKMLYETLVRILQVLTYKPMAI